MYKIVNKHHWGKDGKRYKVGSKYDPTEAELAAFPDRFAEITVAVPAAPKPPTINEVLASVQSGELSPEEALQAESQQDNPRVTLIRQLEDMLKDEED